MNEDVILYNFAFICVIRQISATTLAPKYLRKQQRHDIGYKEYLAGEVREQEFNPILTHKLIV